MSGRSLELLAAELVKCRREGPAPRASFPTMAERSSTTYAHALSSTKPSTSASSSLVRAARLLTSSPSASPGLHSLRALHRRGPWSFGGDRDRRKVCGSQPRQVLLHHH